MITVGPSISAAKLQDLIDHASAGETISLAAGTYAFDRTIVIDRDDITIIGAGSGSTTIELSGSARYNGAFRIGGEIDQPVYSGDFDLAQSALKGATHLQLRDAGGLKAGDHLWIERPNTTEYLNSLGDTEWREDKPLRTSMVEIASVSGNTVTLKNGLAFDFSASDAVVSRIEVAENVRLGAFTIDSGLSESDPSDFSNVSSGFYRDNVVSVSGASHVKLYDIDIREAPSNGFTFAQTTFLDADNLFVDGAHNKGDGGNGYAFQLRALYDSDLSGLSAFDTRHAVLFASWTSEANNTVRVRNTNRDINFHGGDDHHNSVSVSTSYRTEQEADYMSPTLFVNSDGASYGAPTRPGANDVVFGAVWGTNKAEALVAVASGSEFHARAGQDTLVGGAGNDRLHADKGDDFIHASAGSDYIDGGMGTDRLYYAGDRSDYQVGQDSAGRLVISKDDGGRDSVTGVEAIRFGDQTYSVSALDGGATTHAGTDGGDVIRVGSSSDVVLAGDGYDRVLSDFDFTLNDETEALTLTGFSAVDGTGNSGDNVLVGNGAANGLRGAGGDDRIYARDGNDIVLGGAGADELYGQGGDDRISGGRGFDHLFGGAGADTFVFSAGKDVVGDFSVGEGDRLNVSTTVFDSGEFHAAFRRAALASGDTLTYLGIDVSQSGTGSQHHIDIEVMGDGGGVMTMSLYGETLPGLLAGSDWIA